MQDQHEVLAPRSIVPYSSARPIRQILSERVRSLDILDVGCIDHSAEMLLREPDRWLHAAMCKSAKSVTGLDILADEAAKLNSQGFRIIAGDACVSDLGRRFDAIVAGEIIEHIDTPGTFLRNMRRHLAPGGKLYVTTPNVFFLLHMLESVFSRPENRWNAQHVAWYEPFTLGILFARCGLRVEEIVYFSRSRRLLALGRLGLKPPALLSSSVLVVATAADASDRQ